MAVLKISDAGLALIKEFEGLRLDAYPDPGSGGEPWTIGYGHTGGVQPGDGCNAQQADKWLREDVASSEAAVDHLVEVQLEQHQFDALVSFVFNVGQGAFGASTMLKHLNAGRYLDASAQFPRWNRGPNGPMPGLTRRRNAERQMFDGVTDGT